MLKNESKRAGRKAFLGIVILLAGIIYMLCKPYKEATKLSVK